MATNQNFFELTRQLEEIVQSSDDKALKRDMTRKDLLVLFTYPLYVLRIEHEVFIHEKDEDYVPKGTVDFYGLFSDEDKKIHLYIIHNPKDKTYTWNPVIWAFIRGIYVDTLSHELLHKYQSEQRCLAGITATQRMPNFKEFKCIDKEDETENGLYLVSPDEVEADAYNFACQLYRRYRSVDDALNALRSGVFKDIEMYDFYNMYIKKNSYVYKRLLKKTTWFLLHKYDEKTYKNSECNEDVVEDIQ